MSLAMVGNKIFDRIHALSSAHVRVVQRVLESSDIENADTFQSFLAISKSFAEPNS